MMELFVFCIIVDLRQGSKYASEKTEAFKMQVWLAKSSQLLQRAAFLVHFNIGKVTD